MAFRWKLLLGASLFLGLFAFWGLALLGLDSDEILTARWADREMSVLIEPLETFRQEHGAYPEHLLGPRRGHFETHATYRKLPSGRGFPRDNPNFRCFEYAAVDLDDFILVASIRYTEGLNLGCGPWKTIGILTTGRGDVTELPRYLGPSFIPWRDGRRIAGEGRWVLWEPRVSNSPEPDPLEGPLEGISDPDPATRADAASALGRSRNPRGFRPLLDALADEESLVRGRAAWALGRFADSRALPALGTALDDPEDGVRLRARWAIRTIGTTDLPDMRRRVGTRPTRPLHLLNDFEHLDTGENGKRIGWQSISGGAPAVVEGVTHDGLRSLRLSGVASLKISPVPGALRYELALLPDASVAEKIRVGFIEKGRNRVRFYNRFHLVAEGAEGGRIVFRGRLDRPPVDVGRYRTGRWVVLGADIDFVGEEGDLWLDSECVATGVAVLPRTFPGRNGVEVNLGNWGVAGAVHVDDVRIDERHEDPR